jgi:penicillin-binding protein 1A
MATALRGLPDVPASVPDGVMQLKIDPLLGILIGEDEEGIYEYFYNETPPPEVETYIPPLEEPTAEDFPATAFPDSMLDNPLQPPPKHKPQNDTSINRSVEPPHQPANPPPSNNNSGDSSDSASRMMNPSGF